MKRKLTLAATLSFALLFGFNHQGEYEIVDKSTGEKYSLISGNGVSHLLK